MAQHLVGGRERLDQAAGEGPRGLGLARAGLEDRELVAAEPRGGVALAHAGEQAGGDGAQQGVADRVAEGVVDRLEAVEVEAQHRHRPAPAPRRRQRPPEPLPEQRPVRQAGQRVVVRQVLDPRLLARPVARGLAEHLQRCRHPADLVAPPQLGHRRLGVAPGEAVHRPDHPGQRPRDVAGGEAAREDAGDAGQRAQPDDLVAEPVSPREGDVPGDEGAHLPAGVRERAAGARGRGADQEPVPAGRGRGGGAVEERAVRARAQLEEVARVLGRARERDRRQLAPDLVPVDEPEQDADDGGPVVLGADRRRHRQHRPGRQAGGPDGALVAAPGARLGDGRLGRQVLADVLRPRRRDDGAAVVRDQQLGEGGVAPAQLGELVPHLAARVPEQHVLHDVQAAPGLERAK